MLIDHFRIIHFFELQTITKLIKGERCATCGQTARYCPGHCGHIDLAKPCLNPLFYKELKQLIVATCYECGQVINFDFIISFKFYSSYVRKQSKECWKLDWKLFQSVRLNALMS